jgi:hypothetical protein
MPTLLVRLRLNRAEPWHIVGHGSDYAISSAGFIKEYRSFVGQVDASTGLAHPSLGVHAMYPWSIAGLFGSLAPPRLLASPSSLAQSFPAP